MNSEPTVAAIIPTRDRHSLVPGAVRSALGQTYPALEVWVTDDGSNPPVELPDDLAPDPRVHLLRLDRPRGSSVARNEAVSACGAEYVAFLDDDDVWLPRKVERQVAVLRDLPADVAGVESGWEMREAHRIIIRYVPDPARDLDRQLLMQPCMAPSTVLLRRSAFEAVGGFDPGLLRLQDWELWIRLADRYRMVFIPEVHALRRPSQMTAEEGVLHSRLMLEILRPRIDRLPRPARGRAMARHRFMEGVDLARAGRPAEARAVLWRAWRSNPANVRPLFHIGRTLVGERSWEKLVGGARRAAHPIASLFGRDLYLYRW